MKLNKELAKEAKVKGICKEWYDRLQHTEDKRVLIQMFLEGIDFCISEDFPPQRFFQLFDGIRQQYGIFRDEQIHIENSEYVVAFGQCEGSVNYSGFSVGQIFVKDESKLTINASGNAFVMIDIFDNAKIEVCAKDTAKIVVNEYGGTVFSILDTVHPNSIIKIVKKQSKTY
ncbi:MAG: hypothetical protein LBS01_00995 [Prevotellaceae bacterium]|jgi:hypothetical protein|nr:hypothetical protein [Prevotellaceae bacterium]